MEPAKAAPIPERNLFVNDFATRTQGIDLVSTYAPPGLGGGTVFSAVFNYTSTNVTACTSDTIDADRRSALERGLPETRWNVAVTHTAPRWSLLTRLNSYGRYWDREDARAWAAATLGDANLSPLYEPYAGKGLFGLYPSFPKGVST